MALVDSVAAQLKIDEGIRFKPYKDSLGILSIGVGRNLIDNGLRLEEIDFMLDNDIINAMADLDINLSWWRNMNEIRQGVLANMCFNLGINRLLKFANTLDAMKTGDYVLAAQNMQNSNWYLQVGARAVRLCEEMKTGIKQ